MATAQHQSVAAMLFDKSQPVPEAGCWLWSEGINGSGYGHVRIAGKIQRAHRAMFAAVFGRVADGLLVCHKCDTRSCINPDHLFLGTHKENTQDMIRKGRGDHAKSPSCNSHPAAKLTVDEVLAIRSDSGSNRQIAKAHGVSHTTVASIRSGRTWTGVPA